MKYISIVLMITLILCPIAFAADTAVFDSQYHALELDRLERQVPQSAQVHGNRPEIKNNASLDDGLHALLMELKSQFGKVFKKGLSCISIIIAIAVLCAVVSAVYSAGSSSVPAYVSVVSALAITTAASGSITSMMGMGSEAIRDIDAFSKALLPSLSAAVAATGAPVGATVRYGATVLFSDIIITIISTVLLPLMYAYIAAATANAAVENASLSKIADFIQWVVTGSLKIILMIFVGYITVSGIISSTTDVVGAKTAKFAINGAVPVVGGIISDAAETVIAGAMVMKNAIGIFGMLTILSICLTPFLTLAVNYFLFKAAAAVTAPLCDGKTIRLVDQIGDSFGVILGMTASCALLIFVSILSCMYAVGAV